MQLSNFISERTKTLYQFKEYCILFNIFQELKMLVICNNTKGNFSWEYEKINVKFHKNCENTKKILEILCVRRNFMKFDIHSL